MIDTSVTAFFVSGFCINFVAALVPGPDFLLVLRAATVRGRTAGLLTTAGTATGLVIWSALAIVFTGALLAAPHAVIVAVRLVGAVYLGYLGVQLLRTTTEIGHDGNAGSRFYLIGLQTNLTNPKLMLFLVAVLTQFGTISLAHRTALLGGITVGAVAAFVLVSLIAGVVASRARDGWFWYVDRTTGTLLIGFALWAFAQPFLG